MKNVYQIVFCFLNELHILRIGRPQTLVIRGGSTIQPSCLTVAQNERQELIRR